MTSRAGQSLFTLRYHSSAAKVLVGLLAAAGGALALAACGGDSAKQSGERHTVVLEATSDYGRPMTIDYFGSALGPDGPVTVGGKGSLSAESPWKTTLTVDGKDPFFNLSVNGSGCIGRAIGNNECET